MTLEEQFARLVADVAQRQVLPVPNPMVPAITTTTGRTRTVYSVGEAISQKGQGQNAKLGAGSIGNSGSGR